MEHAGTLSVLPFQYSTSGPLFLFPEQNEEFRFPQSSIRLKNRSLKVGYSGFGRFSLFGVCDCEYHSFA
ncbi:hypothetical protein V6N13_120414 [Hibiscus sabdariffa]